MLAAVFTWRFIPESPVRAPGRVNWLAASLMSIGICAILIAIAQTTVWGWGGWQTWALFSFGALVCVAWVAVEVHSDSPLVDMTMMRIRGVWTTNLVAFLLGAGMFASFIVFPQFAQLPKSTGFGFGASVVVSSLYLLPSAFGMGLLGTQAGRVARRYGSKLALIVGTGDHVGVVHPPLGRSRPSLRDADLGRAARRSASDSRSRHWGTSMVQAVPATQTGVATGMNTVMRTLGGALGGQISATFIADHVAHGEPTVTGFNLTFAMATGFLIVCMLAAFLVPGPKAAAEAREREAEHVERQQELVGEPAVR